MPALLTSASMRPKRAATPAILRQSASSATSPWAMAASAPAVRTASAVASASFRLLVQLRITALAPRFAAPMAMAAPRPVAPPVTRITLPSKSAMRLAPVSTSPAYMSLAQHPHRIGQNCGVVEGEVDLGPVLDPLGRRRIVPGPGRGPCDAGEEDDGAGMPAGVPPRVGIDADQPQLARPDTGFLRKLAPAG